MGYHLRTRVAPSPNTTHAKKKRTLKRAAAASQPILLLDLPLAVLNAVLVLLEGKDLGKLQCAISSRQLTVGSYKKLYADKVVSERAKAPWEGLSSAERNAAVAQMMDEAGDNDMAMMFLVDGSGSVSQDDFRTAMDFVKEASSAVVRVKPSAQVGVLQFGSDCRDEVAMGAIEDMDAFANTLDKVVRMSSGTNIYTAIRRAGELCAPLPVTTTIVLCVLTDGQIDYYQSREAARMLSRMMEEQRRVVLYTYGVGRNTNSHELGYLCSLVHPPPPPASSSPALTNALTSGSSSSSGTRMPAMYTATAVHSVNNNTPAVNNNTPAVNNIPAAMHRSGSEVSDASGGPGGPGGEKQQGNGIMQQQQRCFMLRVLEEYW